MRSNPFLVASVLALVFACHSSAQDGIAEILSDPAIDFSRPAERARAMQRIEAIENARLQNARAKAMAMGLPLRMEKPGGGVKELIDFDGGQPVYLETKNANAAISTAANLVRTSPYTLDGAGLTVGVWDAAGGRPTHQEFVTDSRLTNMNGATTNYHSMHVAGTIAALGVDAPSRGMANAARINSYDWNSDISEMGTAGATAAGQTATKVYLSNHSYGTADGWDGNTWRGTGTDQNAYDINFGQYSSGASSMDATAYNTPYLLSFWAAGNERSNNPSTGASVVIGGVTTTYNPTIHPPGDGKYRNGYETISYRNLAKNIVTVGAVNDAVTSGARDLAKATISSFSSTGPTDDGRIKPDLVANGVGLRSTYDNSDTAYASISGTSMATPNACGSAALLVDQYNRLFGSAMRSSTLKALLIQTADDLGNPGPDYFFGWGLIDVKDAADLLIDHQANPTKKRLTEDQVSTSITSRTQSFTWDGVSPIRATLCWTDPAGTSVSSHDSRTPTLKNNLNLKLIAPNGAEYFPFVMPFVGTWTVASMSQNATTGINNTDNVEQVLVNAPGQSGDWQAVVSYSGTLTNNLQNYGLIISGSANQNVPLAITSITPASGLTGTTVTADITGTKLSANTAIRLRQPGRADIIGTSVQMLNTTTLRCQFNLSGVASGLWSIVATNPDTETYTLPDAFTISGSLTTIWSENFDAVTPPTGWTTTPQQGSNSWDIVTTASHTPTKSYFAACPASTSITHLTSPSISIPSGGTNLSIEFWHRYDLESGRDGGRLSLSLDGGAWFDVTSSDSGAAFTLNGYNTGMATNGQTGPFAGLQAWSGKTNNAFVRTSINLNDIPKYSGKSLRLRWELATNNKTASTGWYVDSVALLSDSSMPNQPPVVTVAPGTDTSEFETVGPTTWHVLRGTGTNLSVTATDDAGEGYLTYTWEATGPAPVTYSLNGDNAAKSTTATFSAPGDYVITVTALDTGGLSTASSVNVRVLETSTFDVAPDSAILNVGQTQQFTATLSNQFGAPNASQPSPITWSTTGGGTISSGGLFTATSVGGPYIITATGGVYTGTAEVSVNPAQAGIQLDLASLSQTYTGSQRFVTATTNPTGLNYSITYNGQPTAPTNADDYSVAATITDPNYQGSDSGTLVVAKASQTINFTALDPVYDNAAPFALTATATSGLTVSYTSSNTGVATVSGSTVAVVGQGTTTITASQAGNTNYSGAASVPQTLNVVRFNPLAVTGGPYSVLVGQSVTLNGGASQPSYNETITSYEWDLNNDNSFGDATGASPEISYATLTSNWGRVPGPNTIQLKVTDSSGKTSITSTTLTLIATLTWDANGTTANQTDGAGAWLIANQWWTGSANTTWSSSANAIFGNGGAGGAVTLASPTTVNAITFNSFTGTYTLGTAGQTITLNGGIDKTSASGIVTINSPITLGGAQTWTNNSANGGITFSSTLNNNGYLLVVDGAGATNTGNALVSGAGGLTKNGTGTLSMLYGAGNNPTFSGPLTVNGGILRLGGGGSGSNLSGLPSGNITLNGGVFDVYWGNTFQRALGGGTNQIQIIGGVSGFSQLASSQTLAIKFGNTNAPIEWGSEFFSPTALVLNSVNGFGTVDFQNYLDLKGVNRMVEVNAGVGLMSGILSNSSGTAGLIKSGAGELRLSATNTYNGGTQVNQGALTATTTGALPDFGTSGKITVAGGAMLAVRTGAWTAANIDTLRGAITWSAASSQLGFDTTAGNFTYSSNITEALSVAKINANTLTLSGNNSYTGGTTLNAGTLIADSANALGTSGDITFKGGTLQYTANSAGNNYGSRINHGTSAILLNTNGQNVTLSSIANTNTGGLTKSGVGTLTFTGTNSYSGTTTIGGGSIVIDGGTTSSGAVTFTANNTSMAIINGGTLNSAGNSDIGASNVSGNSVSVVGGNGVTSTWDLGNSLLILQGYSPPQANKDMTIDGAGFAASAVVTNISDLQWGRSAFDCDLLLTNGGRLNVNRDAQIGSTYYGETGINNTITIQGGTANSIMTVGRDFYIGYGDRAAASGNTTTVGAGGQLTITQHMYVGHVNATANSDNPATANQLTVTGGGSASMNQLSLGFADADGRDTPANVVEVTNGGRISTTGTSYIGRADNAGSTSNASTVTVTGTGSSWNAGNQTVYVGYANNASAQSNNNILTVGADGVLTNVSNLTVGFGTGTETGNQLVVNGSVTATTVTVSPDNTLGGSGMINGAVTVNGTLSPGNSIGSIAVGNLAFGSFGSYSVELDAPSVTCDQTTVTGSVSLNAAATLALGVTGTPAAGDKYFIVVNDDLDAVTGTFASLAQDAVVGTYGGIELKISYTGESVLGAISGGNDIVLYVESGGGAPEIAIEQDGNIETGGSSGFGTVTLGGTPASLTFTIRNTGTADLNLNGTPSVAVSGTAASDFTVTLQPAANVTSLGSTTFTVQFAPLGTTGGSRNAVLTILNNDSDEGSFTINVSGTTQTPYEAWSGAADFNADANGDGVKNGLAFLLGAANPNVSALDKLPTVTESGGGLVLNFNCLPLAARGTATLKVAHSTNLAAWTATADVVPDANNPTPDNNVTFVVGAGPEGPPALNSVTATIGSAAAADGKLFGRLEATQP